MYKIAKIMKRFLLFFMGLFLSLMLTAQTDLIISEYVEGWSNNKAIEIYNPTSNPINLSEYRITRYSNGGDVPPAEDNWTIALPDENLDPYRTYVCVLDKRNPTGTGQEAPVWDALAERADVFLCPDYDTSKALYHNGDDAIALEKTDGTLVDLFGRWGPPRPAEALVGGSESRLRCWTDTDPYFTGVGVGITADHTLFRKAGVVSGIKENPVFFNPLAEWDSLPANTFHYLGWHKSDAAPENNAPTFDSENMQFKVWKQAKNGDRAGNVEASDPDEDPLFFYFTGGNFIYNDNDERKTPFSIDRSTGEITVNDASALLESPWDTLFLKITVNDYYSGTEPTTVLAILSETEVSVNDLQQSAFTVYPNPAVGNTININAQKPLKSVVLLNAAGQQIQQLSATKSSLSINIRNYVKGVYFIEAHFTDDTKEVKRFVRNQ
jgi:hypothetical protein